MQRLIMILKPNYFIYTCLLIGCLELQAALARHHRHHAHHYSNRIDDEQKAYRDELKDFIDNTIKDRYYHDAQPQLSEKDLPKNGELFENDLIMDNTLRDVVLGRYNKRSAVKLAMVGGLKHWDGNTVYYVKDASLHPEVSDQIDNAIKNYHHFTNIKWVKRTNQQDYVKFMDGKGCSSNVGKKGGMQPIHLAHGCKRIGTVQHEMMHALGMTHEQSRPDRDGYVKIRFDHVKNKLTNNFQKYSYNEADNMKIPYNFNSVMHYSNYAFSKDNKRTIISKADPTLTFGQREKWSISDVLAINRLYPAMKGQAKPSYDEDELLPDKTNDDVLEDVERREQRDGDPQWFL